jgi:hypothetical protein
MVIKINYEVRIEKYNIIFFGGKIPFWIIVPHDICICSDAAFFLRVVPVVYVGKRIGQRRPDIFECSDEL